MATKFFSPSVNIIRDINKSLDYIPTPNSLRIYNQIINHFLTGFHSINIVGSYGTGKSSFIWAFEKHINGNSIYFAPLNGNFKNLKSFEFLPIIGDYDSIINVFADKLKVKKNNVLSVKQILLKLDEYYNSLKKSKKGLFLVIDEFGKFLEYAAKNNPEHELYFIQQLAEYVNDPNHNIIFITTLHQNFTEYSYLLSQSQRQEWDKVKGRLKEITFNEPVEQLLFLASEKLKNNFNKNHSVKNFNSLFETIKKSKAFPLKDLFTIDVANKLLPMDILSASVITLALQKYGQNERSLFSFIESKDYLGINDFDNKNNPFYNLSCVYDFLIHNYYSFLSTKYNPHYSQWSSIRNAIEKVEGLQNDNTNDCIKLIKAIGLLNIFAPASAILNSDFFINYGTLSLGIKNTTIAFNFLISFKIIVFAKHSNKYRFLEGTDLDIEAALLEAGSQIDRITNLASYVIKSFNFPFIQAKEISYIKGTPRFFNFRISDSPIISKIDDEIDGTINLIFSETFKESDVKKVSDECDDAILYGFYKNFQEIKAILFDIEKIKKVIADNLNDSVANIELSILLQHSKDQLNMIVFESMFSGNSGISWYFKGIKQKISNHKQFNRLLSEICNSIYFHTPDYKCELINKTKLSIPVVTARKNFFRNLVEKNNVLLLGFELDKFPPEKTIYLSLLNETGIHVNTGFNTNPLKFKNQTFQALWNEGVSFINKCKDNKIGIDIFYNTLNNKPYKLKQGFLEFWISMFLFINKDDFALFNDNGYIPIVNEEILELVCKNPKNFEIKAFDVSGVKLELFNNYRVLLNQSETGKPTNKSFIELIKPFLTFYKGLPEYAKKTKRISKKAILLRDTIALSKDPEKTFFEDFPNALGYQVNNLVKNKQLIESYIIELKSCIKEIRTAYDELINRVEQFLLDEIIGESFSFLDYKIVFVNRYKKLRKHLLLNEQKNFYQRLISDLDIRSSWINSISQAAIGKSLEIINDSEEKILYDKFKDVFSELDNLCTISKSDFDESKEDVFKLEITTFIKGIQKKLVRIPKNKTKEITKLEAEINSMLHKSDKNINIALLIKLLQKQLNNE